MSSLAGLTGAEIRTLCRSGEFDRPTAGVALGYTQANLVILHRKDAADFELFCRRNPQPCPILAILEPGRHEPISLARGADLRTDLPRYRVYRRGNIVATPQDISSVWTESLVAILIGCSFTFESALIEAGLPVRHIEEDRNVSMYRTNIPCRPAGPFEANLVVSMRPMSIDQASEAARITSRYKRMHGAPVHIGNPTEIGIDDLDAPDYGDAVTIRADEVPVFWACGVTPMEAIQHAQPDLAITHEPGHMFVSDMLDSAFDDRPS